MSEEVTEVPELWISEYDQWDDDGVQLDREAETMLNMRDLHVPCICRSILYRVATVTPMDSDLAKARWVLESYDAVTGERAQIPFTRTNLGVGEETGVLIGVDVIEKDSFVFQYVGCEQTEEGVRAVSNKLIYTDLQENTAVIDLQERCLEDGIVKDDYRESVFILYNRQAKCLCDGKGNSYWMAGQVRYGSTELFVYNRKGAPVLSYRAREQETIGPLLKTEDGEIVCAVYDWEKKSYSFFWADTEQGEMHEVGGMKSRGNDIERFYGMQGNEIYYSNYNGQVVRWNVETGRRNVVFSFQENGLIAGENGIKFAFCREGLPVLWVETSYPESRQFVVGLSGEEITEKDHVRVADIATDTDHQSARWQVKYCAALSSQYIPGRICLYESGDMNPEAYRDRIFAQLAEGKGPDILYVSREDMYMLEEKGALADIRDFIPKESLDMILPGAMELGMVGGKLTGITPNVQVKTIAVSSDIWEKDRWSLEDFLKLIDEGKLEPWWKYEYSRSWVGLPVLQILEHLCADSFLIDWEKRECYFEDDRVIRLLRAGQEVSYTTEEQPEFAPVLHGGNRISEVDLGGGFSVSSFDVMLEAEGGHCVGWPTEGNCGNYLMDDGFIVINAASVNLEHVKNFLECMLSGNIQYTPSLACGVQITKLPEGRIIMDDGRLVCSDWTDTFELGVFEDGTDSMQRAAAFLEKCQANPRLDVMITKILYEELDTMYSGDRTPEQTAEILNNRVRLYLKETE